MHARATERPKLPHANAFSIPAAPTTNELPATDELPTADEPPAADELPAANELPAAIEQPATNELPTTNEPTKLLSTTPAADEHGPGMGATKLWMGNVR